MNIYQGTGDYHFFKYILQRLANENEVRAHTSSESHTLEDSRSVTTFLRILGVIRLKFVIKGKVDRSVPESSSLKVFE